MEGRDLLERLDNQHEDIEKLRNRRSNDIRLRPPLMPRQNGYCDNHQRSYAQNNSGRNPVEWKEESRHAGRNRHSLEEFIPRWQPLACQKTIKNHKPRQNSDKADQDMDQRESRHTVTHLKEMCCAPSCQC